MYNDSCLEVWTWLGMGRKWEWDCSRTFPTAGNGKEKFYENGKWEVWPACYSRTSLCCILHCWCWSRIVQTYATLIFILFYAVPVGVFIFCYPRMFHVIRRQNKVVGGGHVRHVTVATASRDRQVAPNTEAPFGGAKLSRAELNILQTMIAVIVCFVLCFTVADVAAFLESLEVRSLVSLQLLKQGFSEEFLF